MPKARPPWVGRNSMALHPSGRIGPPLTTDQNGSAHAPWAADLDAPTVASITPQPDQPAPRDPGHPLGPLPAGYGPALGMPAAHGHAQRDSAIFAPGSQNDATAEPT